MVMQGRNPIPRSGEFQPGTKPDKVIRFMLLMLHMQLLTGSI